MIYKVSINITKHIEADSSSQALDFVCEELLLTEISIEEVK